MAEDRKDEEEQTPIKDLNEPAPEPKEAEEVVGGAVMERYDQSAKNVIQSMRG